MDVPTVSEEGSLDNLFESDSELTNDESDELTLGLKKQHENINTEFPEEAKSVNEVENFTQTVLEQLKENTLMLKGLLEQTQEQQRDIAGIKENLSQVQSLKNSGNKKEKTVPICASREVRRIYKVLLEEENFDGCQVGNGITYASTENRHILDKLVKEVKSVNKDFLTDDIKGAAYRFYRSKCEVASAERRGKTATNTLRRRRYERKNRKLEERMSTLMKLSFKNETHKQAWLESMSVDLMSSEESCRDDDEDVIVVRPLSWRSSATERLIKKLDEIIGKERSEQSRRQLKKRIYGDFSESTRPESLPSWV